MNDLTPDGDDIDVRTWWLPLPDGREHPVTLDLTRVNAAVKRFQEKCDEALKDLNDRKEQR